MSRSQRATTATMAGSRRGDAARRPWPNRAGPTSTRFHPICYAFGDPFDHLRPKSLVASDPQAALRDAVAHLERTRRAVVEALEAGLQRHVAGEQQARI